MSFFINVVKILLVYAIRCLVQITLDGFIANLIHNCGETSLMFSNEGSWTCGMISSSTKGITCLSSEEDFKISQRNRIVWIIVSKRKGYITYFLNRCRLGRLHWWPTKHQWCNILLGWVFSILAKQKTIINIFIYSRNRVYCRNIMLYSGSMDETNSDRYTCLVLWANSNLFW